MFNYTVGIMSCQQLTINITMLKYLKGWWKDYQKLRKELDDMGIIVHYQPLSMNPIQPFYIDKERYNKYINDRQKQVSTSNSQSKN